MHTLKLIKRIFGVKRNDNQKWVQKYEILAFEKKIPINGIPTKKFEIFSKKNKKNFGQSTNNLKTLDKTFSQCSIYGVHA